MTGPLVSIVIPCYRSGEYIRRCVESILGQTYSTWEAIFVIDGCNQDTTFEKILYYASEDIRIRYIASGGKTNCATARNTGYKKSNGDYLYFLDADDWLEPQCLETLVAVLENNSQLLWCVSHRMGFLGVTTYLIDQCPGTDSTIGGIGGTLFKRCCLEDVIKKYGYLFDASLNHTDDGDLVLRTRRYPHVMIESVLSGYLWNTEGLTAKTHWFEQQFGIIKMMVKRGAWDLLPDALYNTGILCVNKTFGIDLVKIKKGLFK